MSLNAIHVTSLKIKDIHMMGPEMSGQFGGVASLPHSSRVLSWAGVSLYRDSLHDLHVSLKVYSGFSSFLQPQKLSMQAD